jgi:mRNA-degrading endonuclease RelE of RelBE toxin-antitoxin system
MFSCAYPHGFASIAALAGGEIGANRQVCPTIVGGCVECARRWWQLNLVLTLNPQPSTFNQQKTIMFQIIFTPASAAELARMPKELQLQILGEFRGLPQQALGTELDAFGKLELDGRTLHRFRVGDYRVYFERHELGVLVHRILSRHTLKDFLFRSGLKTGEDEALQENPKFWELIESAKTSAR